MSADTQTHTYTHVHSHTIKPPTAGVQLVGHNQYNCVSPMFYGLPDEVAKFCISLPFLCLKFKHFIDHSRKDECEFCQSRDVRARSNHGGEITDQTDSGRTPIVPQDTTTVSVLIVNSY